jgi:hypothetical protein
MSISRRLKFPRRDALDCPHCHERFCCPVDWGPSGDTDWWILSRCGACQQWSGQRIDYAAAALLDRALDLQQDAIQLAADRLATERMVLQAEAFIAALQRDLIDASDFA